MMNRLAAAASTLVTVSAGTWQHSSSFSKVTNVGGVFATAPNECSAAFTDNVRGPGFAFTDNTGDSWTMNVPYGWLNTDIALDSLGNGVITTIGSTYISQNNGPYIPVQGKAITYSQNVETLGDNIFAVTGTHYPDGVIGDVVNGVALTSDAGKTWSYYDTGLPWNVYVSRYSAFPSKTTWYVAQGSWTDAYSVDMRTNSSAWNVNSRVRQTASKLEYVEAPTGSGNFGAISKTTDGGKTFTVVYDTKGQYYMNSIHCASTEICMAVAEDGYHAIGIRTENGGKTWTTVLTLDDSQTSSLMGCKMLSESEVWLSGGTFTTSGIVGWYYHTLDGGKTWDLQTLEKAYSMDLSFSGGVGYSPAMSETGSTMAVYK